MSGLKMEPLWTIFKEVKSKLVIRSVYVPWSCYAANTKLHFSGPIEYFRSQIMLEMVKHMDITLESFIEQEKQHADMYFDIPNEFIEMAAEMFIYVNLCPKTVYDLIMFYIDLMQNAPPNIIIQTLNRVMITGRKNGDNALVDITKKIFMTQG